MWDKLKKVVGHSLTVAVSSIIVFLGAILDTISDLPEVDPDIKQNIADALGGDPHTVARVSIVVSALLLASRLRSIKKPQ